MTSELVVASTKYAMAEMLLGGVTCVADMYYFEDAVYKAASEMGMRALLGETIIDFATCDTTRPFGGLEIAQKNGDLSCSSFIAGHDCPTCDQYES